MPFVKLSGIFLIVVSCAAAGALKSLSIKNRSKKLSDFCDGLDTLYEHIEQGGTELFYAINNSFCKCNFLCFENNKFYCKDSDLSREDKAAIDEFLVHLGVSAKKAECDRISSFRIAMQKRLKDAEKDTAQKSKIYQTFGICIGLTIGILLM